MQPWLKFLLTLFAPRPIRTWKGAVVVINLWPEISRAGWSYFRRFFSPTIIAADWPNDSKLGGTIVFPSFLWTFCVGMEIRFPSARM